VATRARGSARPRGGGDSPPDPRARFAENLRRRRREAGISQEALAAAARLHRTEISLLERSERDPRLTTVVRLARALRVRPADLLQGIE
jgi:transcriptional regulator with XRE-family HTH domain